MSNSVGDPIVGTTLGSFRIVRIIGRGGMGTVYLGEHTVIGSRVAIKVLQERLATDEGLVARFYAEARAVNLVGHENIVNIFDMNVVPPHRYFLVMEYLEGKPLNALLTAPVAHTVAIPILTQVCDALQAAHDANIIHRDLKPENIFLIKRGKNERFVKVLDFGLAKLLDTDRVDQATAAGLIVGTPEFMSPEQANSTPVDGRADIYALGCIAWLLATARLPFPQRGLTDLLVAHRQLMPEPPHQVNPTVPRAWSDVIMKAMAKKPADRFQTAAEFGAALEAALQPTTSQPTMVTRQPTVIPPMPSANLGGPGPGPQAGAAVVAPAPRKAPPPPGAPGSAVPPKPAPRLAAKFEAVLSGLDGTALGAFACEDISKGGMFLCTDRPMPPVFSRVKVSIPSANNLGLLAEVVRHVPPDQAKAWGMSPGFGVQFLELTPPLREAIARLMQGLPPTAPPPVAPVPPPPTASMASNIQLELVLDRYRDLVKGDHYVMLGATPDADFNDLKAKGRDALKDLENLKGTKLSDAQRAQVDAAVARVKAAIDVLTQPLSRAEFDANRNNPRGIARCIAAGLAVADLDRLRAAYLAAHPGVGGSAHVKLLASKGYEAKGQWKDALDASDAALQIDPLNLQLHQRSTALAKRVKETAKP